MKNKDAIEILQNDGCQDCTFGGYPCNLVGCKTHQAIDLAIKALEERPQGTWINQFIGGCECVMCSECKLHFDIGTNYCPNCGADMRGDNNV